VPGSAPRWFTHPKTVIHPGTNRAWHSVNTLIETNVIPLSQTCKPRLTDISSQITVYLLTFSATAIILSAGSQRRKGSARGGRVSSTSTGATGKVRMADCFGVGSSGMMCKEFVFCVPANICLNKAVTLKAISAMQQGHLM